MGMMPEVAGAASSDLFFDGSLRFSTTTPLQEQSMRIYATVSNGGDDDASGVVRFYLNNTSTQIDSDQPISVHEARADDVFADWIPENTGTYTIFAVITPWTDGDESGNNTSSSTTITVEADADQDGKADSTDNDDDNDGTPDSEDAFPLNYHENADTDGDGLGDNKDLDDDNDDTPDESDEMPLDATETEDSDHDGSGNNADTDDDNDDLADTDEETIGTDPLNPDTDDDTVNDGADAFPLDPTETKDTDNDGTGNNTDTDDEGDAVIDILDEYPENHGPVLQLKDETPVAEVNEPYTFDASTSSDPDGTITDLTWKFDDGTTATGTIVTHTFTTTGIHDVTLTGVDNTGESRTLSIPVTVRNPLLTIIGEVAAAAGVLALLWGIAYTRRAPRSSGAHTSKKTMKKIGAQSKKTR